MELRRYFVIRQSTGTVRILKVRFMLISDQLVAGFIFYDLDPKYLDIVINSITVDPSLEIERRFPCKALTKEYPLSCQIRCEYDESNNQLIFTDILSGNSLSIRNVYKNDAIDVVNFVNSFVLNYPLYKQVLLNAAAIKSITSKISSLNNDNVSIISSPEPNVNVQQIKENIIEQNDSQNKENNLKIVDVFFNLLFDQDIVTQVYVISNIYDLVQGKTPRFILYMNQPFYPHSFLVQNLCNISFVLHILKHCKINKIDDTVSTIISILTHQIDKPVYLEFGCILLAFIISIIKLGENVFKAVYTELYYPSKTKFLLHSAGINDPTDRLFFIAERLLLQYDQSVKDVVSEVKEKVKDSITNKIVFDSSVINSKMNMYPQLENKTSIYDQVSKILSEEQKYIFANYLVSEPFGVVIPTEYFPYKTIKLTDKNHKIIYHEYLAYLYVYYEMEIPEEYIDLCNDIKHHWNVISKDYPPQISISDLSNVHPLAARVIVNKVIDNYGSKASIIC